jgi:hypothetical protein
MNSSPDTGDKPKIASSRVSDYLSRGLYHGFVVNWFVLFLLPDFRLRHAGFQLLFHPRFERFWVGYGEAGSISPAEGAERALKHPRVVACANVTFANYGAEFIIFVHFLLFLTEFLQFLIIYPSGRHPRLAKQAKTLQIK